MAEHSQLSVDDILRSVNTTTQTEPEVKENDLSIDDILRSINSGDEPKTDQKDKSGLVQFAGTEKDYSTADDAPPSPNFIDAQTDLNQAVDSLERDKRIAAATAPQTPELPESGFAMPKVDLGLSKQSVSADTPLTVGSATVKSQIGNLLAPKQPSLIEADFRDFMEAMPNPEEIDLEQYKAEAYQDLLNDDTITKPDRHKKMDKATIRSYFTKDKDGAYTLPNGKKIYSDALFEKYVDEYYKRYNHPILMQDEQYRRNYIMRNFGKTEEQFIADATAQLNAQLDRIEKAYIDVKKQNTSVGDMQAEAWRDAFSESAPHKPEDAVWRAISDTKKKVNSISKNNFWTGFAETFAIDDIAAYGLPGLQTAAYQLSSLNKYLKGKPLTAEERLFVEVSKLSQQIDQFRGEFRNDNGISWSRVGNIVGFMPQFAEQLLITGSIIPQVGQKVVKDITVKAVMNTLKNSVGKGLAMAGKKIGVTALNDAIGTPFMTMSYKNFADRRLRNFQWDGENLVKEQSPWAVDLVKALGETFVERHSEQVGMWITDGLMYGGRKLAQAKFLDNAFGRNVRQVMNYHLPPMLEQLRKNLRIGGYIGEVGSEIYNNIINPFFTGETDSWKELLTSKYYWELCTSMAISTGAFYSLGIPSYVKQARAIRTLNQSRSELLASISNQQLKDLIQTAFASDNLEVGIADLTAVDWKSISKQDAQAASEYIFKTINAKLLEGEIIEAERLQTFLPMVQNVSASLYSGANIASPEMGTQLRQATLKDGSTVFIQVGDIQDANTTQFIVRTETGEQKVVGRDDIVSTRTEDMSDYIAQQYNLLFSDSINKEKLRSFINELQTAQQNNASQETIGTLFNRSGYVLFDKGEQVTLTNGTTGIVVNHANGHYLIADPTNPKITTTVGFLNIMQPDPAIAEVQAEVVQEMEESSVATSDVYVSEEDILTHKLEAAAQGLAAQDGDISIIRLADGREATVKQGNIVTNPDGSINTELSDETIVIKVADSTELQQISIDEVDAIIEQLATVEAVEMAKNNIEEQLTKRNLINSILEQNGVVDVILIGNIPGQIVEALADGTYAFNWVGEDNAIHTLPVTIDQVQEVLPPQTEPVAPEETDTTVSTTEETNVDEFEKLVPVESIDTTNVDWDNISAQDYLNISVTAYGAEETLKLSRTYYQRSAEKLQEANKRVEEQNEEINRLNAQFAELSGPAEATVLRQQIREAEVEKARREAAVKQIEQQMAKYEYAVNELEKKKTSTVAQDSLNNNNFAENNDTDGRKETNIRRDSIPSLEAGADNSRRVDTGVTSGTPLLEQSGDNISIGRGDIRVFEQGLGSERDWSTADSERDIQKAVSQRLLEIAQENGLFIPLADTKTLGEKYSGRTGESIVYIDKPAGKVYKVKNPYAKSALKKVAPQDAIYEHIIHNLLFPEAPYKFEGISKDVDGVRIVLSQPYIAAEGTPSQSQIEQALAARGLYPDGRYSYGNDWVSVTDVEGDNVILGEDGTVYFIDPIIKFKRPATEIIDELSKATSPIIKTGILDTRAERQAIIEQAKANGTWLKAPNGQPTNLSEEQWVTVRTQAFINWFGDWINDPQNASKVLDENGEPLVVYHYSPNFFTEFEMNRFGETSDGGAQGKGFYFSPDIEYAKKYGSNGIAAFLNIRNYIDANKNDFLAFMFGSKNLDGAVERIYGLRLNYMSAEEKAQVKEQVSQRVTPEMLAELAQYDGTYLYEKSASEWVAGSPSQIKSATDNFGTFDPTNNDIRFMFGNEDIATIEEEIKWKPKPKRDITYDNFYDTTGATFVEVERPNGVPDHISRQTMRPDKVSSEYWYGEDEGGKYVVRGSDHWSATAKKTATINYFYDSYVNRKNVPAYDSRIGSCWWGLVTSTQPKRGEVKYGKVYLKDINDLSHDESVSQYESLKQRIIRNKRAKLDAVVDHLKEIIGADNVITNAEQMREVLDYLLNEEGYQNGNGAFSMSTYAEEGRQKLVDYVNDRVDKGLLAKADADAIVQQMDDIYAICEEYKDKYAPFGEWSDAAVIRDEEGKPVFSVIKKNGEYAMNLDFSLVCKKRRTLDAVFRRMIDRGIISNYELGQVDVAKINDIIRRFGFETACRLCFVDAKRFRVAQVADVFCEMYNPLTDLNEEQLRAVIAKEGNTTRGKVAKMLIEHPENRVKLSRANFMESKGFENMSVNREAIMKLYNMKKGTGGPKASYGDTQYVNDILGKQWTPEDAYAVGGVRLQSFSDYVPRMVFDYIQMVADLAAKDLPVHSYTKEVLFAQTFGLTGIKINLSLVPKVVEGGIAAGLDANGDYVWQEGETFPYEEAIAIQNAEGYRENCGTIAVGVSDAHILKLLGDENIRMVIPYHKSGLNKAVAIHNNIDQFTDYTNEQNTRQSDGTKLTEQQAKAHFNFNEELHRLGNPRLVAEKYLEWCDQNGYIPKFDQFRNHPNYYKLLEDFTTCITENGVDTFVPQGPVQMNFPTEQSAFGSLSSLIEKGLEEDAVLEGQRNSQLDNIVDTIENELGNNATVSVENADLSTFRKMKTSKGEVYGFTYNGKIYLDPTTFNLEAPVHEYTELWCSVIEKQNPLLWAKGKELLRQTITWQQVNNDPNYRHLSEDLRASETLSRIVAAEAARKINEISDSKTLIAKLRAWIRKFWNELKATFSQWTKEDISNLTLREFKAMPFRDLIEKIDPRKYQTEGGNALAASIDATELNEIRAERKQIEEQAKANGTWLKAPNGQPTNLTPEQWITVHTHRFKEWFGDWGKAFIYDYITKLVAVKAKQMPANKSSEEVFKSLPTAKNKIDGLEVNFFNSAFGKIVKIGGISETIIATLPEIFEESILAYSEKDNRDGIVRPDGTIHKAHPNYNEVRNYVGKVVVDGVQYYVRFTVNIQKNQNGVHSYFATDVSLYKTNSANSLSGSDLLGARVTEGGIVDTKLETFLNNAKLAYENSSKIVDANGEPMPVYHGSTADNITEFDKSRIRANETDANYNGFWFSTDEHTSPAWRNAKRIYTVFLNIKNPIVRKDANKVSRTIDYDVIEELQKEGKTVRSLPDATRYKLQQLGYDGVINFAPAVINEQEFRDAGRTLFVMADGYAHILSQTNDGIVLYEYDPYAENKEGNVEGIYDSLEDFYNDSYYFGESVFVAFEPNQIKSVDNTGTFDSAESDIRYSQLSAIDAEYMDAVRSGDMERAKELVRQYAETRGYTTSQNFRDAHSAPTASVEKKDFTNAELINQQSMDDSSDVNLFSLPQGENLAPNDFWSPQGPRWYGYNNDAGMQAYTAIVSAIRSINYQLNKYGEVRDIPTVKVYRAVPTSVEATALQNGDWVTPSKLYADRHGAARFGFDEYKIIEQEVPATELWWDGNDAREWGYDNGNVEATANTPNNVKLLDPITYDNDGNIIPLSSRFDQSVEDPRFMFVGEKGAASSQDVTTDTNNPTSTDTAVTPKPKTKEDKLQAKIADLRAELNDRKKNLKSTLLRIYDFLTSADILNAIETGVDRQQYRAVVKNITTAIEQSYGKTDLTVVRGIVDKYLWRIEDTMARVLAHRRLNELTKVLNTAVEGYTPQGVRFGKRIDDNAREVFKLIRDNISEEFVEETTEDNRRKPVKYRLKNRNEDGDISTSYRLKTSGRIADLRGEADDILAELGDVPSTEDVVKASRLLYIANILDRYDRTLELNEQIGQVTEEIADLDNRIKQVSAAHRAAPLGSQEKAQLWDDLKAMRFARESAVQNRAQLRKNYAAQLKTFVETLNALIEKGTVDFKAEQEGQVEEEINWRRGIYRSIKDPSVKVLPNKEYTKQGKKKPRRSAKKFKRGFINENLFIGTFANLSKEIDIASIPGYWLEDGFYYQFMLAETGYMYRSDWRYRTEKKIMEQVEAKVKSIFGKTSLGSMFKAQSTNALNVIAHEAQKESGFIINQLAIRVDDKGRVVGGYQENIPLTIANLLYIRNTVRQQGGKSGYVVWGIPEARLDEIVEYAESKFPEYCRLADYVVNELLPELYEMQDAIYFKRFGTHLTQTQFYFPIARDKRFVGKLPEVGEGEVVMPSSVTGNIVERVKTSAKMDLSADMFSVLRNHIKETLDWCAYSELTRKFNMLSTSRAFRNMMEAQDFSAEKLKQMYEIAIGQGQINSTDETTMTKVLNSISKSLVAGNLTFNLNAAIKQVISMTAILGYTADPKFLPIWAKNYLVPSIAKLGVAKVIQMIKEGTLNPVEALDYKKLFDNWQWGLENIPTLRARWESRNAGFEVFKAEGLDRWDKVVNWITKIGLTPNAFVDLLTCANGARSVYEYQYAENIKKGLPREQAHRDACVKAAVCVNETQQSGLDAFLSSFQAGGGFARIIGVGLGAYQNTSMSFARNEHYAADQIFRMLRATTRQRMIDTKIEEYRTIGYDYEHAKRLAKKDFWLSFRSQVNSLLHNGIVSNFAWTLGGTLSSVLAALFAGMGDWDEWNKFWDNEAVRKQFGSIFSLSTLLWQFPLVYNHPIAKQILTHLQALRNGQSFGNTFESPVSSEVDDLLEVISKQLMGVIDETTGETKMQEPIKVEQTLEYIVWAYALKTGTTLNQRIISNIASGIKGMIEDGVDTEDIMNILSSPRSLTRAVAGEPREGESQKEYLDRMSFVYRMISAGTGDYDSKWQRERIKEYVWNKERPMYTEMGIDPLEVKALDSHKKAISKSLLIQRSGKKARIKDGKVEAYKQLSERAKKYQTEMLVLSTKIGYIDLRLESMIEFDTERATLLRQRYDLEKELYNKWQEYQKL